MNKLISFIFLLPVLSGCQPIEMQREIINSYVEPKREIIHATLSGEYNTGFAYRKSIIIELIDKQMVTKPMGSENKTRLLPGSHLITLYITYLNGLINTENKSAKICIRFTAIKNQNYFAQAEVKDEKIIGWITDSQGHIVSQKISSPTLLIGSQEVYYTSIMPR